jgi:hypothetical protein
MFDLPVESGLNGERTIDAHGRYTHGVSPTALVYQSSKLVAQVVFPARLPGIIKLVKSR